MHLSVEPSEQTNYQTMTQQWKVQHYPHPENKQTFAVSILLFLFLLAFIQRYSPLSVRLMSRVILNEWLGIYGRKRQANKQISNIISFVEEHLWVLL